MQRILRATLAFGLLALLLFSVPAPASAETPVYGTDVEALLTRLVIVKWRGTGADGEPAEAMMSGWIVGKNVVLGASIPGGVTATVNGKPARVKKENFRHRLVLLAADLGSEVATDIPLGTLPPREYVLGLDYDARKCFVFVKPEPGNRDFILIPSSQNLAPGSGLYVGGKLASIVVAFTLGPNGKMNGYAAAVKPEALWEFLGRGAPDETENGAR